MGMLRVVLKFVVDALSMSCYVVVNIASDQRLIRKFQVDAWHLHAALRRYDGDPCLWLTIIF